LSGALWARRMGPSPISGHRLADASLALVRGDASLEIGVMSRYNSDDTSYGGWLTLKWTF